MEPASSAGCCPDLRIQPEIELSVVLPCLNESATLEACIRSAQRAMAEANISGEVVVADNGSTDASREIALRCGAVLSDVREKGYGNALMGGIAAAGGRFIIMGDADGTYDFSDLPKFIQQLRDGCDLVMGNRFAGGIQRAAMPFLHRYLGTPVLSGLGRLFFPCHIGDFNCGLRGFSKAAYQRMELSCTGMEFASEMLVKASVFGLHIAEVPTTLRAGPPGRSPHLRTWRDGWRHLRFLLLYSPKWLFFVPGILIMAMGISIMSVLEVGPLRIGSIVFDVHTMVYAACMALLGFQTIVFSAFARIFAATEGFLPADRRLQSLFRHITLETGVICGAVLAVVGLLTSVYAVIQWGGSGFGPLDYSKTMRIVIPAALALTVGVQIIFSSFFLSLLGLKRR